MNHKIIAIIHVKSPGWNHKIKGEGKSKTKTQGTDVIILSKSEYYALTSYTEEKEMNKKIYVRAHPLKIRNAYSKDTVKKESGQSTYIDYVQISVRIGMA